MALKGKLISFTPQELDELSQITEQDIENVNARWKQTANRWAKNLLVTGLRGSNANNTDNN